MNDTPTPNTRATDQARIRKERREAKIRHGGTARLSKITGISGGVGRDKDLTTPSTVVSDPREVEISSRCDLNENDHSRSEKIRTLPVTPTMVNKAALHQMMHDLNSMNTFLSDESNVFTASPKGETLTDDTVTPEDPMMKIFQKMIGSLPPETSANQTPDMLDFLNHESKTAVSQHANFWRFIHAISAIAFGLYIALLTGFAGTKYERERSSLGYGSLDGQMLFNQSSAYFFYLFITIEVVLVSSRYFLDKKETQLGGILGLLIGFLQDPYKKYFQIFVRYMNICTTVSQDLMICIFVLGGFAWWKGRSGV